ncbi:protein kinase domain-containing protein [Ideonella sp.]|uniref:protein kinase domain-containing protein n=1 Tax=Ideonella sp. TaxID=1929293 RepID=UPI002B4AAA70|nr:HDOD domain-containing protein [Ideonella sp.]HJV69770.1 HDOD domain-containing protein [Ideonella sp.]
MTAATAATPKSTARAAVQRVGRFELQRVLGRGAQATVWLGWDPKLQREVAVKVVNAGASTDVITEWLAEARATSALAHPGIVPVYDADQDGEAVFLVFERVDGPTLFDKLKGMGPMPAREAAELMREVLDALAFAHARGVVHRDLKPSNILVGGDGRARVMDFGIAAKIAAAHDGRIVGTPGYISPEAASGQAPAPAMDVFAAGMMLGQLLLGAHLRPIPATPQAALRQVIEQDLVWPDSKVVVDDKLRTMVMRATARSPEGRFASAAEFRDALARWLTPPDAAPQPGGHGTLEFLLRRMRLHGDFPALSDSVMRIQRVTASENESLQALSAEILKDVALTQKLLRLVNTAHFRHVGAGEISTVSRATALIGFAGIRNMALSVVLLEHMKDQTHAQRMKELFLAALLTGTLVDQLSPPTREREEAFLGGMLSHLGRMLAEYYFPEEAAQIRQRSARSGLRETSAEAPSEARVAADVLGLSYDDLGLGVAQSWGLPDHLRRVMSPPQDEVPGRAVEAAVDRMRWRVRASGELVQILLEGDPAQTEQRVLALGERYARALDMRAEDFGEALKVARVHLSEMAISLKIEVGTKTRARRLMSTLVPPALAGAPAAPVELAAAASPDHSDDTTLVLPACRTPEQAEAMLSAGIADVTSSMAGDSFRLNEVLKLILDTIHQGLAFDRVVFCLRDAKSGLLTGRIGLGEGGSSLAPRFVIDARGSQATDLFAAACLKGADTLITDGRSAGLAPRLPAWYRGAPAMSFLLLPMMLKGAPFALIYADRQAMPIDFGEKELSLLRTLRNQAVMAFKAAG